MWRGAKRGFDCTTGSVPQNLVYKPTESILERFHCLVQRETMRFTPSPELRAFGKDL